MIELTDSGDDDYGVSVGLANDNSMYKWFVTFKGPEGTIYEGGYFKTEFEFPTDYPNKPPTVKFACPMWHPNSKCLMLSILS